MPNLKLQSVDAKTTIYFALLPDEIKAQTSGKFISYDFIKIGEVKMPSGLKLASYSWKGTFPGAHMKDLPFVKSGKYKTPKQMTQTIETWRKNNTKLKLTLSSSPISSQVYIKSFEYTPTGGVGNYSYSIELIEAKDVKVTVTKAANTQKKKESTRPSSTGNTTPNAQTTTYTVKKGDSLWNIAKKYYGSGAQYTKIYNANKSVIGSNPNLTYPGQVLTIPS